MRTAHTIVIGDARDMKCVRDESIHLVVTSPPYWQIKDYGTRDQIGYHDSYESYINNLNMVWAECFRVMDPGCRLCINIGDQFARSTFYGRYKVIPIRTEIIRFCETIGYDYMGAVIWHKITTTKTSGGATIMGSFPYPRNGILKLNYEFILIFKKRGKSPRPSMNDREESKLSIEEWNTYFSGHWTFPGTRQVGHSAQFPEELPKRLIRMFSFVGDTVLDPFLGSGTTSVVAASLQRHSVGYEINETFEPMILSRLSKDGTQLDLLEDSQFETDVDRIRESGGVDIDAKMKRLPYIFRDPVALSTKIKKQPIDLKNSIKNPNSLTTYRVSRTVSPESIELEERGIVQLAGIRENAQSRDKAMEFLRARIQGKRVLIKWERGSDETSPSCYVLLKNRTNINAHLIKNGLVDVDMETSYRMKTRFIRYAKEASERATHSD